MVIWQSAQLGYAARLFVCDRPFPIFLVLSRSALVLHGGAVGLTQHAAAQIILGLNLAAKWRGGSLNHHEHFSRAAVLIIVSRFLIFRVLENAHA